MTTMDLLFYSLLAGVFAGLAWCAIVGIRRPLDIAFILILSTNIAGFLGAMGMLLWRLA